LAISLVLRYNAATLHYALKHREKVSRVTKDDLIVALESKLDERDKTIAKLEQVIDRLTEAAEESNRINDSLNEIISGLMKTVEELTQEIKELNERLKMNSKNSSKPPSSDVNKPAPKSLKKPSGKKPGGQPGHAGSHFNITLEPDEIILHMPPACLNCPSHDECASRACVGETRNVVDAVVTVKTTAHQSLVVVCPLSGMSRKGMFPDDIKAKMQYGENLQALVVALNTVGAVSVNRTHEIISGIFGVPLSTGTIVNMVNRCADGLTDIIEIIRQKVIGSEVGHFDETGTNVGGKNHWVHGASTSLFTHLSISGKRGFDGMEAGEVLPYFTRIAVHDCWPAYWKYLLVLHALCNAHILRELVAAEERQPERKWAEMFIEMLLDMKKARDLAIESGKNELSEEELQELESRYDTIIEQAHVENPPPPENEAKKRGRKKKGKTLALIERLEKHKASVCLFIHNFEVPFSNNLSERDIRMIKTKTKVSGCFRSLLGAKNYLKIMSYVGSSKKHGKSAYEAIRQAISGNSGFFLTETR
jgi:transposase